jgi:hypothetical protein
MTYGGNLSLQRNDPPIFHWKAVRKNFLVLCGSTRRRGLGRLNQHTSLTIRCTKMSGSRSPPVAPHLLFKTHTGQRNATREKSPARYRMPQR